MSIADEEDRKTKAITEFLEILAESEKDAVLGKTAPLRDTFEDIRESLRSNTP